MTVPLIREFRKSMPEATLSISEGLSVAMQESLVQGRLDIALLYNAVPASEIELMPLLEEPLFLVQRQAGGSRGTTSGRRRMTLAELAALPLLIPSRPNAIRMLVETMMAAQGLRPKVALEIDGVAAILDLVEDGAGCAILPGNAVATSSRPQAFSMRPIGNPPLRSKLAVAVSSQRPATLTQKAVLALIQQATKPLLMPS
jgi:LysR family nitrogen assimilation transcriptional regulator